MCASTQFAEIYATRCVQLQELGHAYLSELLSIQIKEENNSDRSPAVNELLWKSTVLPGANS